MRCLLLLSLLIAGVFVAAAQEEDTVKLLNPTSELEEAVSMALKGCEPPKTPPHAAVNENGVYVLDGDLFRDGHSYAVIDHDPLLIAE